MKRLWTIFTCLCAALVLAVFFSCAAVNTQVPEGCENSLIYASGVDINTASIAMRGDDKLLILGGIDSGAIKPEDVMQATAAMRALIISGNPTYHMVALFIDDSKLGLYISLFAELVPMFQEYSTLLDPCDADILLNELDKVDMLMSTVYVDKLSI